MNDKFPLIEVFTPSEAKLEIKESTTNDGRKKYKCRGRFQMAEAKNRNNRIYSKHILEREVHSLQSPISEMCLFGEMDHPKDRLSTELKTTCMAVTELHMDGNECIGEYEALPLDPYGKNLIVMLENGFRPGISSRGAGKLVKRGDAYYVDEDFKMTTFDIVSNESTYGAKPILAEGQVIDLDKINESLVNMTILSESVKHRINNLMRLGKHDAVSRVLAEEYNLSEGLYTRVRNLVSVHKVGAALNLIEAEDIKDLNEMFDKDPGKTVKNESYKPKFSNKSLDKMVSEAKSISEDELYKCYHTLLK